MKRVLYVALVLVAGAVLFGTIRSSNGHEGINYRLATVERGDIESVVSATGTLEAVTTVQVGTQVSGIIDEIYVDYNDTVEAGQVIARVDTTLLANAVAGAAAQLARSEAELRQAQREFKRLSALHQESFISEAELNEAQYNLESARASVQSAEVDLTRSQQNLSYATVTSPIAGTVITRSVDPGQTVQSSFSSPELFLIAGDLSRMQILVPVDESDIGQIKEGQTVRFTVQAYADDTFTGTVRQVRLESTTEENVVNYVTVVDVINEDRRLLPGMTATVDFLVETASDVFYVANASLRYRPDQDVIQAAFERLQAARTAEQGDGDGTARPGPGAGGGNAQAEDRGMLWTVNSAGELDVIPVRTGISDGVNTAIDGRNLEAGLQVVAGVSSSAAATSTTSSPFQQQNESRRPGPPPPGGF